MLKTYVGKAKLEILKKKLCKIAYFPTLCLLNSMSDVVAWVRGWREWRRSIIFWRGLKNWCRSKFWCWWRGWRRSMRI